MTTHTTSTRVMQMAVALALVLFVSGSTSLAQRRGGSVDRGNVRSEARTNVNGNYSVNRNQNVNVNRNTNVNVDRDVNVNVHGDCCGCCYHSGWGTAAAVATTAVVTAAVVGSRVATLPPACATVMVNGFAYQQCGSTWYQPQIAGGSTTYVVVNPPR